MAHEHQRTEYEALKRRMLPSCTSEEQTKLAGIEAEKLAGTKTDAQILSALVDMMVHSWSTAAWRRRWTLQQQP